MEKDSIPESTSPKEPQGIVIWSGERSTGKSTIKELLMSIFEEEQ